MSKIFRIVLLSITLGSLVQAQEHQGMSVWTRISTSFAKAHDYHGGSNSLATRLFDGTLAAADYEILSYQLEGCLGFYKGFYFYTNINYSDSDINGKAGTPANVNDNTSIKLRSYTLGLGHVWNTNYGIFKGEVFYNSNEDDDFLQTPIPVTNGSDSLMFSVFAEREFIGLKNKLKLAYQNFEEADIGNFTLGDSYHISYELGKQCQRLYIGLRHGYTYSEETDGAFIYDEPKYADLTLASNISLTNQFSVDTAIGYIYAGSDAPEQFQYTIGLNYSF